MSKPLCLYADSRSSLEAPRGAHLLETIQILKHVLSIDPTLEPQREKLLTAYSKTGFTTETLDTANELLRKSPKNIFALKCKTRSLIRLRQTNEAFQTATQWADAEPGSLEANPIVEGLLIQRGEKEAALKRADDLVASNPSNVRFRIIKGITLVLLERPDEAKALFKEVANKGVGDAEVALVVTDNLNRLGLLPESYDFLTRSLDQFGDERLEQRLLRRLWQSGQHADVVDLMDKRPIKGQDLKFECLAMRAVSLQVLGRSDEAAKATAELHTSSGPLAEAWGLVPDYISGKTADETGSRTMRDAALRALANTPDAPYLKQCLAEANVQLGERALAINFYKEIIRDNAAWMLPIARLSNLLLVEGNVSEAFDVASLGVTRSPNNTALLGTLVHVWDVAVDRNLRTDENQLFGLTEAIQKAAPGEAQSLPVYVKYLSRRGRSEDAKQAVRLALAGKSLGSEGDLLRLIDLSRVLKLGLEDEIFQVQQKRFGESPAGAFTRAYTMFASGNPAGGREYLKQAKSASKATGKEEVTWKLALVRYLDLIHAPEAASEWAKLADEKPDDLAVQQATISAYTILADREFQSRVIDRIRKLTGEDAQMWRLARARWYVHEGFTEDEAEKASVLANEVLRASPDSVDARVLLAQCLERLGNLPKAIEHLSDAARLDPQSQLIGLYFAQILQKSGDYNRASGELNRITQREFANAEQRRGAAILLAAQGDARRAVNLLEVSQGQSVKSDLVLATLYYRLNRYAEAEQISNRLIASPDPEVDAVKLAAELYGSMGKKEDGLRVLQQLNPQKLRAGQRELMTADFLARYGSPTQSIELLKKTSEAAPQNVDVWRALMIVQLQSQQVDETLKTLNAALVANTADPSLAALDKQRSLIKAAVEHGLTPLAIGLISLPEDKALLDTVNALTAIEADQVTKSLVNLNRLASRYPNSLPVQMVVAERYMQLNQSDLALNVTDRAIQSFPGATDPLRLETDILIRKKNWSQALAIAKQWRQKTSSADPNADLALALCLSKTGDDAGAVKTLEPYLSTDTPTDRSNAAVVQWALAGYRLKQIDDVDKRLEPLIIANSRLGGTWYSAVAAEAPKPQALRWLELGQSRAKPEYADQLAIAVAWEQFGVRFADAIAADRAESIFRQIESRTDLPPGAIVSLASRRERRNDLDRAETLYRAALEKGDPQGIVRNNLAMVLQARGQPVEAMKLATEVADAFPASADFQDTIAAVLLANGKTSEAIDHEFRAVRIRPQSADLRLALAEMYCVARRFSDAKQAVNDINALFPGDEGLAPPQVEKLNRIRQAIQNPTAATQPKAA